MNQCTKILALMLFGFGKPVIAAVADEVEAALKAVHFDPLMNARSSHLARPCRDIQTIILSYLEALPLKSAYEMCYQSIEELTDELTRLGLPHSPRDIASLLYNRRAEIITELLLVDLHPESFVTTIPQLCFAVNLSVDELKAYALNFALFLTHNRPNDKSPQTIENILTTVKYLHGPKICKLLLIAGVVPPEGREKALRYCDPSTFRHASRILMSSHPSAPGETNLFMDAIVCNIAPTGPNPYHQSRYLFYNNYFFDLDSKIRGNDDLPSRSAAYVSAYRAGRAPQNLLLLSPRHRIPIALSIGTPVALSVGAGLLIRMVVYRYRLKFKARHSLRTIQLLVKNNDLMKNMTLAMGPLNEEPTQSFVQEIASAQRLQKLYEGYELEKISKELHFIENYASLDTKKEFLKTYQLDAVFFKALEEMHRIIANTKSEKAHLYTLDSANKSAAVNLSEAEDAITSILSSVELIKKSVEKTPSTSSS